MKNNKKQILVLTLGLALSGSGIALAGPYCRNKVSEIIPQKKVKFLEICKYIDRYNESLKGADIPENREWYNIPEKYFIDLIMQGNRDKVQEYLNNYLEKLNHLVSLECTKGGICYCSVIDCKDEILSTFKALEKSVYNYLK